MNIEKLEKLLKNSYKKETAYLPYQDKWSKENPTCGQCAVTSLIVQNILVELFIVLNSIMAIHIILTL